MNRWNATVEHSRSPARNNGGCASELSDLEASPLTPTGMSENTGCHHPAFYVMICSTDSGSSWQFTCLEDAKNVLSTCKGFHYWMFWINAGMLLLKLTHPLAIFWWLNHPHTRMQTTDLAAHSCRLSCWPRTMLLTSITWWWSCVKHAWSLASSCLPTWSSLRSISPVISPVAQAAQWLNYTSLWKNSMKTMFVMLTRVHSWFVKPSHSSPEHSCKQDQVHIYRKLTRQFSRKRATRSAATKNFSHYV